ncbi:MAG: helix-turn-helix domain-containing protein [Dehalococcoidia bacterium]|nr:helix-turn-helix domain-containing protein [Dehalococcoidia bacterium]
MKERLQLVNLFEAGSYTVAELAEHFRVSRTSFYKWWHRYQEAGRDLHVLKDLSRRPHSYPRAVSRATA